MPPARTVADAADAFLARATATTTRRSYGQTMSALTAAYGDRQGHRRLGPVTAFLPAPRDLQAPGRVRSGPRRRDQLLRHAVSAHVGAGW